LKTAREHATNNTQANFVTSDTRERRPLDRAGPRLRCFLGRIFLVLAGCLLLSPQVYSQLTPEGALHVSHIQGIVASSHGKPVAGAKVTLSRGQGENAEFETTTDDSGRFHFDHVSGQYLLDVERTEYAGASREVIVGEVLMTVMHRDTIYVIVGPGACTDDCSSVFASRSEFDRIIKRNNGHNY
jgi:5-hydroxyisourate hydrolase-like protein (transthyretin family)